MLDFGIKKRDMQLWQIHLSAKWTFCSKCFRRSLGLARLCTASNSTDIASVQYLKSGSFFALLIWFISELIADWRRVKPADLMSCTPIGRGNEMLKFLNSTRNSNNDSEKIIFLVLVYSTELTILFFIHRLFSFRDE